MLKHFLIPKPVALPVTTKAFFIRLDFPEYAFDLSTNQVIGQIALLPTHYVDCEDADVSGNHIWTNVQYGLYTYDDYSYAKVEYDPSNFETSGTVTIAYTGQASEHISSNTVQIDMTEINSMSYPSDQLSVSNLEDYASWDVVMPLNLGGRCWRMTNVELTDIEYIPNWINVEYTIGNFTMNDYNSVKALAQFIPDPNATEDNIVGIVVIRCDDIDSLGATQDISALRPVDIDAAHWYYTSAVLCDDQSASDNDLITYGWTGSLILGSGNESDGIVDIYYQSNNMVFGDFPISITYDSACNAQQ